VKSIQNWLKECLFKVDYPKTPAEELAEIREKQFESGTNKNGGGRREPTLTELDAAFGKPTPQQLSQTDWEKQEYELYKQEQRIDQTRSHEEVKVEHFQKETM